MPTKYEMEPCNILISESQERMLIVSPPENKEKIFEIFEKWELEYSVIGTVNTSGEYKVYNNKEILYREKITNFKDITDDTYKADKTKAPNPLQRFIMKVKDMKRWSVYDSTVGNRTIKGPDKPGSYSIIDIYENNKKLYLTWGESIDECYNIMKEFEKVKPLCVVNCLNFGHPKDSINDFSYTINNMANRGRQLNIPVVGGNVSLYNSTDGKSIRPTPILLMMGIC